MPKWPLTLLLALADEENTTWNFCPSIAAAYLFAILFALTTAGHVVQAIIHRKGYSWVIIVSGLLQTFNYIFRIISIKKPTEDGPAIAWFILILVCFRLEWKIKPLSRNQLAIDRTLMDQCICLHGHGTYGL